MTKRLTIRLLKAIEEALSSRVAGEIDIADEPDSPERLDYLAALDWVDEQIEKRKRVQS